MIARARPLPSLPGPSLPGPSLCAAALAATLALAPSPARAQAAPPIVGGEETTDFAAVGVLVAYDEDRGGAAFCSGTLVAPRWVLTAGHCLEAADGYTEQDFGVVFAMGTSIYDEGGVLEAVWAEDWLAHPDYTGMEARPVRFDAGLVHLERPVRGVGPLALNAAPPDAAWHGRSLDYVGWGITSDGALDAGIKRHVQIPYADADEWFIYTLQPGTNLCSGDSGGAALLPRQGGGYLLAGVNSFVFATADGQEPCTEGGAGATRVDGLLDWIGEHVDIEQGGGVAWVDGDDAPGARGLPMEESGACSALPLGPMGPAGIAAMIGALAALVRRQEPARG